MSRNSIVYSREKALHRDPINNNTKVSIRPFCPGVNKMLYVDIFVTNKLPKVKKFAMPSES